MASKKNDDPFKFLEARIEALSSTVFKKYERDSISPQLGTHANDEPMDLGTVMSSLVNSAGHGSLISTLAPTGQSAVVFLFTFIFIASFYLLDSLSVIHSFIRFID